MRILRASAIAALAACGYTPPVDPNPMVPDAGPCLDQNATCAGDLLRICDGAGAELREETCTWGCDATVPACKRVVPAGGGVVPGDLFPASFDGIREDFSLSGTLDGSNGTINGMSAASLGLAFASNNGIGIFKFKQLSIGVVTLTGTQSIALIADGAITINGLIGATGRCDSTPEIAGPGGGNGGLTSGGNGALSGGGEGGTGGGGGGYGGKGGDGGGADSSGPFGGGGDNGGDGGNNAGDATITLLRGGAGGGAGQGNAANSFRGGGGGGAIQLVSNVRIEFVGTGGINAGGCGGRRGADSDDDGGGGGAGGTILLEAPIVILGAGNVLAANGGGGGGGGGGGSQDGGDGKLSDEPADGGNSGGSGNDGDGGDGGAGNRVDGLDGVSGASNLPAGGGGGGVGRIRINTRDGAGATTSGLISPSPTAPNTTSTLGTAIVQ